MKEWLNYDSRTFVEIINFDKYIQILQKDFFISNVCKYYKENKFNEIVNIFFKDTHKNKHPFLFKIAKKYNFLVTKYDVTEIIMCDCCKEKTKEIHLVLEFLEE
jgi:hypothetical protein